MIGWYDLLCDRIVKMEVMERMMSDQQIKNLTRDTLIVTLVWIFFDLLYKLQKIMVID